MAIPTSLARSFFSTASPTKSLVLCRAISSFLSFQASSTAALSNRRIHPTVRPLEESTVAQARPLVRTLFLAVIVVLFIACANLAGLLLVRFVRRRREISVRMALGASRAAVLRHSLVESLLLSICGGLLGLALAVIALRLGVRFLPETLPRVSSISLDWKVVAFSSCLLLGKSATLFVSRTRAASSVLRSRCTEIVVEDFY